MLIRLICCKEKTPFIANLFWGKVKPMYSFINTNLQKIIFNILYIILIVLFFSVNCASLFDGLIKGRSSSSRINCDRLQANCQGKYSEYIDKNGEVHCSCSGETR